MSYTVSFTSEAEENLIELKNSAHLAKRFKAVSKALGYLAANPRHPSLQTHRYSSISGPDGEKVFEAYAENDTPAAYRIFFYYGHKYREIVVFAITSHP
ncbi:MAG: hypothetical protein KKC39_00010 [Candidatus Omnitrophica bacterium]|nr:hypothetical protein [Candidatus Omnitrophota bacterium]MBU4467117.1 hypothetical protein [Candidatus Omnitrophota bacterium]MCG2708381.1 hypothetical protein [Candidatus Omnitrophota bacterium]